MALKQQFQQKLQQKLSPLQLQIIKLLEFSVLEFEEKIKTELEENPALEEGVSEEDVSDGEEELSDTETDELFDVADYMDDGDDADYSMPKDPNANSSGIYSIPQSEGESFHEHLLSQLNLLPISEQQFLLAEYVVGNIDEEGYLRREIAQIATDISIVTGTNITESALFEILAIVQQLEPSGVGARSLQECLLLQLQRKKITPSVDIAMRLLEEYFTEFSNKHYDKIMAKLEIDDDT
ncbi:MAG: RNA polymerase sigma-54 factor, partial [Paludibacteraceae bacterium]|nr:RNA polymerase sigma-54 factor [Paludibacteraceae bacterium]